LGDDERKRRARKAMFIAFVVAFFCAHAALQAAVIYANWTTRRPTTGETMLLRLVSPLVNVLGPTTLFAELWFVVVWFVANSMIWTAAISAVLYYCVGGLRRPDRG
jgi:hypothetical protein